MIYGGIENKHLLELVDLKGSNVLDVGCGIGTNSQSIKNKYPKSLVSGITFSNDEALIASKNLDECVIANIEDGIPQVFRNRQFDLILFSHVLEHLREPDLVLREYANLLSPQGEIIIALPNVAHWRSRLSLVFGDFNYQDSGLYDRSHLRFFSYHSTLAYLLSANPQLKVVEFYTTGQFPLFILKKIIPKFCIRLVDRVACRVLPNLFGDQILIKLKMRAVQE